jgi:hypothetical protein
MQNEMKDAHDAVNASKKHAAVLQDTLTVSVGAGALLHALVYCIFSFLRLLGCCDVSVSPVITQISVAYFHAAIFHHALCFLSRLSFTAIDQGAP